MNHQRAGCKCHMLITACQTALAGRTGGLAMSQSPQWITTARLLRRTGFGASGPQIDAVAKQDWPAYLDAALNSDPEADPGAMATPMPKLVIPPDPHIDIERAKSGVDPGLAKEFADFETSLREQMDQVSAWWLRRMAAVEQPIHEKLTLLWHNHFATSREKVGMPDYMARQNQTLRSLKLGDFRTLAYAMLTDAAMVKWLDGNLSTVAAPNENLSREFMELFALGHGNGYTQADVREGARALTGWTVSYDGTTSLDASNFDSGEKTVLGVTGRLDAAGFCNAVLAHPNSAKYLAARLWRQLASDDDPSPQALDRFVAAYGPDRDLKALTKAILIDPEFIARSGTVVDTPVEWLMGLVRSFGVPLGDWDLMKLLNETLGELGHQPFYPPDVGGWPSGQAWLSTASAGFRLWTAYQLATKGDLSLVEHAPRGDRVDAAGYLIGIGAWSDRTVAALKPHVGNPQQLVAAAVNSPEYLTS